MLLPGFVTIGIWSTQSPRLRKSSHDSVARVAVVEDFDDEQLPCACAFIVSEDVESNQTEIEQELRALAAESLPRFKRPRRYIFLDELPYTATGKIQRYKLRIELRNRRS